MNRIHLLIIALLIMFVVPHHVRADEAAANASFQTRMRETLRNTMQQLSDAQNQLATAQAAQAQSDKDKAALAAQVDDLNTRLKVLNDQSAADKDAAAKALAALNDQFTTQTKQVAQLNDALSQWKVAYNQMAALAKSTEEKRSLLDGETIRLKRLVDDRELKNAELYNTATEILTRYEQFGLGDALAAKEPFIGVTRVRLQELVQDYKDKLLDRRIIPGQAPSTPPPVLEAAPSGSGPKPTQTAQVTPRATP